jgi:N-acetylmuramoyl-L-alanine amidase
MTIHDVLKKSIKIIVVGSFFYSFLIYGQNSALSMIDVHDNGATGSEVTLTLTHETDYQVVHLHHPERLAIDLDNTQNLCKKPLFNSASIPIHNIRFGYPEENKLRVVFDLNYPVNTKIYSEVSHLHQGEKIFVDFPLSLLNSTSAIKNLPKTSAIVSSTAPKKPVMQVKGFAQNRSVIIVIDAGHGGKDPGATGVGGVHEKEVVLSIAKQLATEINHRKGMKAVLTRDGDYYLELRERLAIARKNKADIFIAIHADAFKNAYSRGASIYALSLRGASSEAARWLAAKENYSELGGVDLKDKGDTLRSVLIDLSQTAAMSSSIALGNDILGNLSSFSKLHYAQVEQAAFVVLKSPDIPSVLIETGFISNKEDEKNLSSSTYQTKLAKAIADGISLYLIQHPNVSIS